MAAPVAHIFCALAILNSGALQVKSAKDFIIGTSFPDIRYIAKLQRNDTHKVPVTWTDVQNAKTSFEAGVLFHSLVDEVRIKKLEVPCLPLMPYTPSMKGYLLKCYEDLILHGKFYDQLKKSLTYFDEILPEEIASGISEKNIRAWHTFIQRYCSKKLTATHIQNIIDDTPHFTLVNRFSPPSFISKAYIALMFYRYSRNKKLTQSIKDFYTHIEEHAISYDPYAKSSSPTAVGSFSPLPASAAN